MRLIVSGHKLVGLHHNGERGEESNWTYTCECGEEDSHSTRAGCRDEHHYHKKMIADERRREARRKLVEVSEGPPPRFTMTEGELGGGPAGE